MQKQRHLLKSMMIVTTTGYIVSAIGPYLADGKNSDAKILNHIICTDTEEIKTWLQEDDVLIVDRVFRDSSGVLADLAIQMEMPSFLQRGHKQHTTEDANSSRLITKPPLSSGNEENGFQKAAMMRHLSTQTNLLQIEVGSKNLQKKRFIWRKIDDENIDH